MAAHRGQVGQQLQLLLHPPGILPSQLLQEADEGSKENHGSSEKGTKKRVMPATHEWLNSRLAVVIPLPLFFPTSGIEEASGNTTAAA